MAGGTKKKPALSSKITFSTLLGKRAANSQLIQPPKELPAICTFCNPKASVNSLRKSLYKCFLIPSGWLPVNPNFGLTGSHPEGIKKHLYSDFLTEFTDALGLQKVHIAVNSL